MKIAVIGAGSYGFTYKLVCDILSLEALQNADFSFMDVDAARLENVRLLTRAHMERADYRGHADYTLELESALKDADFIINLVKIGFLEASVLDMEIPKKYGLYQTIGDTCGVAGVSRGLRTMLFNETLLRTAERAAKPGVVVLNYTNPQPMCVMAASAVSGIPFIGLCHSVQGTTMSMAKYVQEPYESIRFEAAGINHLSFITRFEKQGEDLYPRFREAVKRESAEPDGEQIFAAFGPTRIDLMGRVGCMVTESSNHLSEYVPFYLRTPELRARYHIEIDRYRRNIAQKEASYKKLVEQAKEGALPLPTPSVEYGPQIINAMTTGVPCKIYANVMNRGLITNLPAEACVEVACLVDRGGVQPCQYGALPWQLAALCSMETHVHRLAADAVLHRDPERVYWALLSDPVAHGILDADQIRALTDELLEAQKAWLPTLVR